MKKIVVFLLITAFASVLYAQNNDCKSPLPNQQFLQKYNQIKSKPTDASKLNFAKQIVNAYCFSSAQVKELASLFQDDYNRLEFAKAAYYKTTDKENFYDVYDAFIYYSVVFRLHDYIKSGNNDTDENTSSQIDFPEYDYPPFRSYRGKRNCPSYINPNDFISIVNDINSKESEQEKYVKSAFYVQKDCFPTEYLMKISSLLSSEDRKLDFAKGAINSVYDIDNYIEMKQIFNTPRARSEFINFLASNANNNTGTSSGNSGSISGSTNCSIPDSEYQKMVLAIKNERFNTNKVNSAKHIIQTKKCFSTLQIKGFIELFDYENSRLELAKYNYDFVTDRSDYYSVVSQALGFESSKQKLLEFIKSK